ncbi:24266_t:CDS:1, partial [Gigaspora margarita]
EQSETSSLYQSIFWSHDKQCREIKNDIFLKHQSSGQYQTIIDV